MSYLLPFVVLGLLHSSVVAALGGPLLNLSYAQYEGYYEAVSDSIYWYGVRYAQPPLGELRWSAPQDIELNSNYSSLGVINATMPGPQCVQGITYWQVTPGENVTLPGDEDCLLLNIQVPAHPVSNKLPILFQIHGGGYTEGNASLYPGDPLMIQGNGSFIYVSIQYRLSYYGFLSSKEVIQNGAPNAGLLDQRAAILWTQRNALAFGGDPSKITITGGSAGGGSVMNQMILYGGVSNPPFRAVISEYPWWQPYHNDTILESQYRRLLSATGCGNLACLRGLDQATLSAASPAVYQAGYLGGDYAYGDFYFGPAVDGEIVRDLPSNEFKQGHFTKVPLLVDRDGYEGVAFTNLSYIPLNDTDWVTSDLHDVFPYAGQSFVNRIYELYPSADYNSSFSQRSTWYGDFVIACPSGYMASAVADWGLPTYKLLFYAGNELHAATAEYLYGNNNDGTQGANDTIGTWMKDWWLSFTTTLDPNAVSFSGQSKPYWPTYNTGSGFQAMNVNYTQIGVVHDFDDSPRCDFFHAQSYVVRN